MKNFRRHLGPGYTMYPAKQLGEYLGDKIFKLIMWAIGCVLWAGVYYIGLLVLNFNRENFMPGGKTMTAAELGMTGGGIGVYVVGCFIILVIVIRSRRGSQKQPRRMVTREDRMRRELKK